MQLIKPAIGRVTSQHGEDIGRGFPHVGVDLGHGDGRAADLRVIAPAAGKVTTARAIGSYGNCLIIQHDDGTWTRLAHLARFLVTLGQRVEQGQDVGVMGNTGTVYVHLHWEYHLANTGTAVNPLDYLGGSAQDTAQNTEQETPLMKLVLDSTTGTAWYLAAPGGIVHIKTVNDLNSVRAVLAGNASFDQIKAAEGYLKQLRTGY